MTSEKGRTKVRSKRATAYHFILFYCTWPPFWNSLMLVRCVYDMQRSPFLWSISLQCGDWYLLYLNNNVKAVKVLVFRCRNNSFFFFFMNQCPLVIVISQPRNRSSLCVHWKKCKIVNVQQLNTSLHTNGLHLLRLQKCKWEQSTGKGKCIYFPIRQYNQLCDISEQLCRICKEIKKSQIACSHFGGWGRCSGSFYWRRGLETWT